MKTLLVCVMAVPMLLLALAIAACYAIAWLVTGAVSAAMTEREE